MLELWIQITTLQLNTEECFWKVTKNKTVKKNLKIVY